MWTSCTAFTRQPIPASVGAVVDYVTRMPTRFAGSASLGAWNQNFKRYNSSASYGGTQGSASLGSRSGDRSWWVHVNHTDSTGQPPVFAARLLTATAGAGTTPVTGAVRTLSTTTSRVQNIDAVNPKAVASLGIDNLTDETYWSFHPYPQRTYVADLRVNF